MANLELRDAHVLVTGGAGFIGSHLVERLRTHNRVRVLDIMRRDALRPAGLHDHKNVELVVGDVLDQEAVRRAVKDTDIVIHLASIAGVDTVMRMPTQTMRVSLLGTAFLLEAAQQAGRCRRFLDFSTSEVFGRYAYQVSELDATTVGAVGEARWTYAVSKLATEHLAMTYHRQFQFPAVTLRPFNIYGPRQIGEGAVHHFIVRALREWLDDRDFMEVETPTLNSVRGGRAAGHSQRWLADPGLVLHRRHHRRDAADADAARGERSGV